MGSFLGDVNVFLRITRTFREIVRDEAQANAFAGDMVLRLYQQATTTNLRASVWTLREEHEELTARLEAFLKTRRGEELNCLPDDALFSLLLLTLSFLPPRSPNYAGVLNEIGRYLQSVLSKRGTNTSVRDACFQTAVRDACFQTAVRVYEEATEVVADCVNESVVLSNMAQLIRLPLQLQASLQASLPTEECQSLYGLLHWVNTHLDVVLQSSCSEQRKQAVSVVFDGKE